MKKDKPPNCREYGLDGADKIKPKTAMKKNSHGRSFQKSSSSNKVKLKPAKKKK